VITADPKEFLTRFAALTPDPDRAQPRGVFLVAPTEFRVEDESAVDNVYLDLENQVDAALALKQSNALGRLIESTGLEVTVFPGSTETPDAVFPNNAFATRPGKLIVGSMRHPIRRLEAQREDIRGHFSGALGYEVIDLSAGGCVAELTGPLIIDRARNVGFCGMSSRVDEAGLRAMHEAFALDLTLRFDLQPGEYHTNVVLAVLAGRACVICPDAFVNAAVVDAISSAYAGHTLTLGEREKRNFAANCIALSDSDLFMSARALGSLTDKQRQTLQHWGFRLHGTDLSELERAGGSLRCMVAEIF
jgi:hypothetical protein